MRKIMGAVVLTAGLLFAGQAFAATYVIDPVHSSVGFSVKHMMISTVTGTFDKFEGTIDFDSAKTDAFKSSVTIDSKSINTRTDKRDTHLRSADFFDTDKFPTITFVSKSLKGDTGSYSLTGDLTIKGVTKEVSIPVAINGPVKGMDGAEMIGLSGQLTINRQDYGVNWNKTLDAGGLAVSNDVAITVNFEAHEKK